MTAAMRVLEAEPRYQTILSMFAIEGVTGLRLTASPDTPTTEIVSLSFNGWSPSLHAVQIRAHVEVGNGDVEAAVERFQPIATLQESRWRHAYGMSRRTEPFSKDPLRKVEHLEVDAAVAALAHDMGMHLRPTLRDRLGDLHQFRMHPGGAEHWNDTSCVMEMGDHRIALTRIVMTDRGGATFDGRTLVLPSEPLPETVLGELTGRAVSDVSAIHPLIDGRTIVSARNVAADPGFTGGGERGPTVELRVEPQPVDMPEK